MEYSPILVPVVALVAWTLVVMVWMVATRLPALEISAAEFNHAMLDAAAWMSVAVRESSGGGRG